MTYRILLAIALVGLSSSLSTGGFLSSTTPSATRSTSPADTAGPAVDSAPGSVSLRSRRELPKRASDVKVHRDPETGETDATGRIVIKFRDHLRVRAPLTPMDRAMSDVDPSVGDRVAMMLARHGGTISQWINRSPERLAALERRAAENSGRAQPDLAGMLVVSFHEAKTDEALEAAATEFQGLASVEFVVVEHAPRAPFADYHSGAEVASAQAGIEDPASDSTAAAPVSVASDEFVPDEACRKRVAEIVPECDGRTGAEWDARCLAYAHSLCEGSVFTDPGQPRPNPCFSDASGLGTDPRFAPFLDEVSGPCDRAHDGRGCNRAPCCREVCAIDPNCCEVSWDEGCVALAHSTVGCTGDEGHGPMAMVLPPLPCGVAPPAGAGGVALGAAPAANAAYTANTVRTPDLSGVQVYRKQATATLPASWIGTTNFLGQGFNLDGANSLASLQDDLFNAYGLGPINRAGATVRVGVMDYSAYLNHEDFIAKTVPSCTSPLAWELLDAPKVIGEPDQTVLLTQGADNDPNHGTSVLGIIVAANQDVTGTPANENFGAIGLAHNAQGYLFPLVSIEEGYRPQNAITSCFETFATGDVLVVPWAPAGFQGTTLVSNPDFNTLIRLGSDLGVTTVCQAGDQSVEVLAQPADSGAIVVGSVTSGRTKPGGNCGPAPCAGEWKRGINSNFSDPDTDNDPDTGHPLASVDVAAWMGGVFTTGLAPVPPNPLLDAVLVPSAAAPKNFPNTTLGTPPGALNLKLDNPLEVNKLRNYNQAFGGTSAATAMIGASVALLQATTKQAFGGGTLVPEQMRQVLADWGDRQCNVECMVTDPPQPRPQDCCACGATSCGTEQNLVGSVVPNLYDCGIAIFTNDFSEGNPTEIELRTGFPINGTFSPIFIRAVDRNYLRIGTVQASAGSLVDGLRYLATGPTTDLYAKLRSSITDPNQIENLGLIVRGRATAPVTIVGGFMYNYAASRWDFIGAGVYLPAVPQADVAMPILNPNLSNYFTPSGVFKARIWTCSLGPAGPNQVWHDFISIGVNDPAFVPAP